MVEWLLSSPALNVMNFIYTGVDITHQYDDVSSACLHRELPGITVFTFYAWTTYDAEPIAEPCMTLMSISMD